MANRTYFFFGHAGPHPKGPCRTTRGKDFVVHGGETKEDHEQVLELTQEVSKLSNIEKPETKGEFNLIVRDAMKKVGMPTTPLRCERRRE